MQIIFQYFFIRMHDMRYCRRSSSSSGSTHLTVPIPILAVDVSKCKNLYFIVYILYRYDVQKSNGGRVRKKKLAVVFLLFIAIIIASPIGNRVIGYRRTQFSDVSLVRTTVIDIRIIIIIIWKTTYFSPVVAALGPVTATETAVGRLLQQHRTHITRLALKIVTSCAPSESRSRSRCCSSI